MRLIADEPILRCIERSGYPPWLLGRGAQTDTQPEEGSGGEDEDGEL